MTDRDMVLQVHTKRVVMDQGRDTEVVCKGCGEPWPCPAIRRLREDKS